MLDIESRFGNCIVELKLLWRDDKGEFEDRVCRAARRYREKFGRPASLVLVNENRQPCIVMVDDVPVRVEPSPLVWGAHYLVGGLVE